MKKYQLTLLSLCVAAFAQAKVTLPSFFTDNMVIQQNSQLTLPGKAKAGKQVTVKVSWNHEKYTAKASADGHFSIEVPTPPAGGPYQIIVSDGEKTSVEQRLIGRSLDMFRSVEYGNARCRMGKSDELRTGGCRCRLSFHPSVAGKEDRRFLSAG